MKQTAKPNGGKRPARQSAAEKGKAIGEHLSERMAAKKRTLHPAIKSIDFEADAKTEPESGELSRISSMVERQLELGAQIAKVEEHLLKLKAQLRQVQEVDLPEAMRECGFDRLPIKVLGKTVELKSDLTMSIPKEAHEFAEAIGWLRGAGLGDLIERDVTVAFGLGEEEKAQSLADILKKRGHVVQLATNVNTARVKAAVRELLAKGQDVPLETLGAYRWTKAIVS